MKTSNNTHQKPLTMCQATGKVVYATRDLAIASMQYLNRFRIKGSKKAMNVYHCKNCKGFHLTSMDSVPAKNNSKAVINTHKR